MTTEVWRVHILWIFQITKITRVKSPIQNCLRGGFRERVGMIVMLYAIFYRLETKKNFTSNLMLCVIFA